MNAPADGNGRKVLIPVEITFTPPYPFSWACGEQNDITLHVSGWLQFTSFFGQPDNRNVLLDAVNLVFTFTNSAGARFVWHEVGADHYHFDGHNLLHVITGKAGDPGIIGRLIVNTDTGDVQFVAGNPVGNTFDLACDALT